MIEISVTEKFIRYMIQEYVKSSVNSDGCTFCDDACNIMDWNTIYILLREKSNETNQSVFQRSSRIFWWLLSMYAKWMQYITSI